MAVRKAVGPAVLAVPLVALAWVLTTPWSSGPPQVSAFSPPQQGMATPGARAGGKPDSLKAGSGDYPGLRAAFLWAEATTGPVEQSVRFERLMAGVTPEQAARVLGLLSPEELEGLAARQLFERWASGHPREALDWAGAVEPGKQRLFFESTAVALLADADLPAAIAWVLGLAEGVNRDPLLAAVGNEAVETDPIAALRLAALLADRTTQTDLVLRASAAWGGSDFPSAVAWAEKLDDVTLRLEAIEAIALASAAADPYRAAASILEKLPAGDAQDRAIGVIAGSMAQASPDIALTWVSQFPEDRFGNEAMDAIVSSWTRRDPEAPGRALLSLPMSPLRQRGILKYSGELRRLDPIAADRWEAQLAAVK